MRVVPEITPQPHQTPHSRGGLPLRVCVGLGGSLGSEQLSFLLPGGCLNSAGSGSVWKTCHLLLPAHSPDWLCHLAPEPLNKEDPQWSKTEILELQRQADSKRPTKTEPGDGETENKENTQQEGCLGPLGGDRPGDSSAEGSAFIHSLMETRTVYLLGTAVGVGNTQ